MVTFERAVKAFKAHEAFCEYGQAGCENSRSAWHIALDFFHENDINSWVIGAVILGSPYYAKFITQNPIDICSLEYLEDRVAALEGEASQLAHDLIKGNVRAEDFKNIHTRVF